MRPLSLAIVACSLLVPGPARAQTALPMGAPERGAATGEQPAAYAVKLDTAGVLTVAVQGGDDLVLQLTDADGQALPEGLSDQDLQGSTGTEVMSVTIARPGEYRVLVSLYGSGTSQFEIAGSFLSFPPFERPEDPDGRPSTATALTIGEAHEDSLDTTAGDAWDWFVFTPAADATLAVATRAAAGVQIDLQLDVYVGGSFDTPADSSDQDQQDDAANEAVTVAVRAGQPVHVRVSSPLGEAKGGYRISSSLISAPAGR